MGVCGTVVALLCADTVVGPVGPDRVLAPLCPDTVEPVLVVPDRGEIVVEEEPEFPRDARATGTAMAITTTTTMTAMIIGMRHRRHGLIAAAPTPPGPICSGGNVGL